ncbi:Asp23/Gls24 family envelope stress response protein [Streptomyces sp. NPDC058646]|uniref:Asp23/Gls24 family envelope stress response protein n=1 Tax=Streptomyces sp. NPDC058646 TaxID=3346574 RepID=UPI003666100C
MPAAERGATVIPDKVVARIAARAAREALAGQTGATPARLGLAAPRSTVAVSGGSARLGLSLDLPYPIDIAGASREVQHYVGERVAQLTGMRITEVTVTIQQLVPSGGLEHRRIQ